MSRIGKKPVEVPKDVKVDVKPNLVSLQGPKGKLELNIPHGINVEHKEEMLHVNRISDAKIYRSNHGTVRAHLANMVTGITKGHKRELEIQGIGFRASLKGNKIVFSLGFSHPVEFEVPKEVKVTVPSQTAIILEGEDIEKVGLIAAQIRGLKPAEPYKGKGIRYLGEVVRRKQGKSVTK